MIGGHLKSETEETLLKMIKSGNYCAFDEIYSRHFQALYGMAYNILRDHQQSKDIIQDIFVWFWEHREQWNLTSCKGYLITAVKFKTANYFRENKVKAFFFDGLAKQQMPLVDENTLLEVKQLNELILSLITDLPERCQQIFRMSRFEYLSNKQIAAQLGITEKAVEAQITSGLKKLKNKLGRNYMFMYFFI